MALESIFLIFVSVGVFSAALGYGVFPSKSLPFLYDISLTNKNMANIFRAVTGLYIAFAVFWFLSAFHIELYFSAILSLILFMSGIAFGRIASIIIDGLPDIIIVGYLIMELVLLSMGYFLILGIS